MNRRPTTLNRRSPGVSQAEMRARVAASLDASIASNPRSSTPVTAPSPEAAAIIAEEKFYADRRVAFRN